MWVDELPATASIVGSLKEWFSGRSNVPVQPVLTDLTLRALHVCKPRNRPIERNFLIRYVPQLDFGKCVVRTVDTAVTEANKVLQSEPTPHLRYDARRSQQYAFDKGS